MRHTVFARDGGREGDVREFFMEIRLVDLLDLTHQTPKDQATQTTALASQLATSTTGPLLWVGPPRS